MEGDPNCPYHLVLFRKAVLAECAGAGLAAEEQSPGRRGGAPAGRAGVMRAGPDGSVGHTRVRGAT